MCRTTAVLFVPIQLLVLVLVLVQPVGSARSNRSSVLEFMGASINASVLDGRGNVIYTMNSDDATFGQNSPKIDIKGVVITPSPHHGAKDRQGCDPHTGFLVPGGVQRWVALLQRGNCTFKEKILKAAAFNASAVLIYNNSTESTVRMGHEGTGDTVAVMVTEAYGKEILSHLDRNLSVVVCVSAHRGFHKDSRGSLLFVSVSFIVLMIVSSAWLVFYFIQKIRFSRDRGQRRLGDAAKRAIKKLNTRTVKKGDKETDPDFSHCAVCIETYRPNDVVRILPCKHVFHKVCVDPWLNEHCTCPMCKLNILKALGISASLPCVDSVLLDVDRLGGRQTSGSQRALLSDSSQPSISLEPLSDADEPTQTAADISVAVTSSSFSSHSLNCDLELPDLQAVLQRYDEDKS